MPANATGKVSAVDATAFPAAVTVMLDSGQADNTDGGNAT
jgi:hypothetical protein